jgi:two-component system, LytTR family, response regulator LytT
MLNIAICDDLKAERQIIIDKISHYIQKNVLEANILEFQDGEDLLEYIHENEMSFDIIFLDIYMNCMNGMETARKIREVDNTCNIIFITTSGAHAVISYEVRATYYLMKPLEDDKLYQALEICMNDIGKANSQYTMVKQKGQFYKLLYQDILYVESKARILLIHTMKNDVITIYRKLTDFEEELNDKRFIRCHKSYLVNLYYVLEIKDSSFLMENKNRVPISNCIKETKKIYMDYLLKKL